MTIRNLVYDTIAILNNNMLCVHVSTCVAVYK